jgi:N-methylhydantoinase A/oxoprolinase/acetone carboxylase beta subunit
MKAEGRKDLLGEGIQPENLSYAIEFDVSANGTRSLPIVCSESALKEVQELRTALVKGLTSLGQEASSNLCLELIRLRVRKPMSKPQMAVMQMESPDSSLAYIGSRRVLWGSKSGEAQVYRWESLRPGNRVEGCAVLEGLNTTYLVPDGWTLKIDRFGNGEMARAMNARQ